ncbi:hypothetical protein [Isoptericola croceus]|uniref:hypothetical protein n=1 Tax=Isoptericola croceus TaxID=3031406 RepID=UPI0023F6CEF1|nr:hypothetical protein [Isoptericola croceus]
MDIITTQQMGGTFIEAGDNSALSMIAPAFCTRKRHGAGAALVDLAPDSAPDSAPRRHPVH